MRLSDAERFQSYVLRGPTQDSCWIWLGAVSDDGYEFPRLPNSEFYTARRGNMEPGRWVQAEVSRRPLNGTRN